MAIKLISPDLTSAYKFKLSHTLTSFFCIFAVKNPSVFNVGRFQVTPSKDVSHQEPCHLSQATPTAHSPPPSKKNQTESSNSSTEDSESESSIRTSTPGGYPDNTGGQEGRRWEENEKRDESRMVSGSRSDGSSGSPMMSSSFSQSLSHCAPYLSSDESESENEEMWEELQKLRQR